MRTKFQPRRDEAHQRVPSSPPATRRSRSGAGRWLSAGLLALAMPAVAEPLHTPRTDSTTSVRSEAMLAALLAVWPRSEVRVLPPDRSAAPATVPSASAPLAQIETLSMPQRPSSALGVEQVRVPPPQPAADPGRQAATAQGPLLPQVVRTGEGRGAAPETSTSANCSGTPGSSECLLETPRAPDWRRQTGIEIDTVSGAPLVPGVTLNPTRQ